MKNVSWFNVPDETSSATKCQTLCSRLSPRARMILSKLVWVTSTARNAVVVIVCALMAYGFDPVLPEEKSHLRNTTFILTGNIQTGIPSFQPPPFSVPVNASDPDSGHTQFVGMVSELGSAIIIIPLLVILENVAIAKAFGMRLLIKFIY